MTNPDTTARCDLCGWPERDEHPYCTAVREGTWPPIANAWPEARTFTTSEAVSSLSGDRGGRFAAEAQP